MTEKDPLREALEHITDIANYAAKKLGEDHPGTGATIVRLQVIARTAQTALAAQPQPAPLGRNEALRVLEIAYAELMSKYHGTEPSVARMAGIDAILAATIAPPAVDRAAVIEIERLQFELKAARNELEIADGEIDRLKALAGAKEA
jgi:hypothetical protein